jgi:hypothetical protein
MYTKDGNRYFIVDSHVHLWDAHLNAAALYGIDVPAGLQLATPGQDQVEVAAGAKEAVSL